jgi:hypothetical protein
MDVISFLCVSLGSSTVHLPESVGSKRACLCSEAGFTNQIGELACGVYYKRAEFSCAFLWPKGFNAKDIHRGMFPAYGEKRLSRETVHNWVANLSLETKR